MSSFKHEEFEDYSTTSNDYDMVRVPVGIEQYIKRLKKTDKVLDAGAGTGNYLLPLSEHVGEIKGIELNEGMIKQAQAKIDKLPADRQKTVSITQGSLLEKLPFEDNTFDAVVCNQVIHHLDVAEPHANLIAVFQEWFRVLKPGGWIGVNWSAPDQQTEACWFYEVAPKSVSAVVKHHPSVDNVKKHLTTAGFASTEAVIDTTPVQGKGYFDLSGAFKQAYRNCDSVWSQTTKEELDEGLGKWRGYCDNGTLHEVFGKYETARMKIGHTTFVFAQKK